MSLNLNKNTRPDRISVHVDENYHANLWSYTYWDYIEHFTMIALRLFEYDGLPEGLFSKTIEEQLFFNGKAILTRHPVSKKLIVLPCSTYSQNALGQPKRFKAYAYSSDNTPRVIVEGDISYNGVDGDGVLFMNNYLAKTTQSMLGIWCSRLADIDMTRDQIIFAMRKPFIVLADRDTENSAKALFAKYQSFEPLVVVENEKKKGKGAKKNLLEQENMSIADKFSILQTGVEDHTASLQNTKQDIINWIYTMFNINNGESRKKERMLVDEVNINNEQIDVAENISLTERQESVEIANKLFNLNMSVERSIGNEFTNDGGEIYDDNKGSSGSISHESVPK